MKYLVQYLLQLKESRSNFNRLTSARLVLTMVSFGIYLSLDISETWIHQSLWTGLSLSGRTALTRFMEVYKNQHNPLYFLMKKYNCTENWNSQGTLLVHCPPAGELYLQQYDMVQGNLLILSVSQWSKLEIISCTREIVSPTKLHA